MYEQIKIYVKESYDELVHKVTWPTWPNLQSTTIVVLIATMILAIIIFMMDLVSKQGLELIYRLG